MLQELFMPMVNGMIEATKPIKISPFYLSLPPSPNQRKRRKLARRTGIYR